MSKLLQKIGQYTDRRIALRDTQEPALQEGTVAKQRDGFRYDVVVRGRLLEGVQCCIPYDGIYAEMFGQVVWVFRGTEPLIVGIKYPANGGPAKAMDELRRG